MATLTKHAEPIPHAAIDLGDGKLLYVTELPRGGRMLTVQESGLAKHFPGGTVQTILTAEQVEALKSALDSPGS